MNFALHYMQKSTKNGTDLTVKLKIIKLPEENIKVNLCDPRQGNISWRR